ncbi:hypothetical protein ACFV42_46560 [Streptomyces solisilvae]|uniref:hypothetical protein n=1 Tax=Streptomyces malaysiensis TaxID=92644 RepID=UPI0036A96AD5
MSEERAADEIRAGHVIEYTPGGLMLVTDPGEPESIRFVGRRVGHHGVTLTVPHDSGPGTYAVGRPMSTLHTPRQKVTVHERRAYSLGDGCPCDWHRERRGEKGPAVFPPVVGQGAAIAPARQRPALPDTPVAGSARVRRRRGGSLVRPAARPALATAPDGPVAPAVGAGAGAPVGYRLALKAAPLMGDDWSAEGPCYKGERAGYLVHSDGRRLKIEEDDRPKHRATHVCVTVRYPHDAPVKVWPAQCPETRFRHDRPVSALVAQIRDKILPTYDAEYPEIRRLTEEHRRAEAADESFAMRIACTVPGGKVSEHDSSRVEAHPFPRHIEQMRAYVSSTQNLHRVEFRYVDSATLEALTQTYAAMVRAKSERRAASERGRSVAVR